MRSTWPGPVAPEGIGAPRRLTTARNIALLGLDGVKRCAEPEQEYDAYAHRPLLEHCMEYLVTLLRLRSLQCAMNDAQELSEVIRRREMALERLRRKLLLPFLGCDRNVRRSCSGGLFRDDVAVVV